MRCARLARASALGEGLVESLQIRETTRLGWAGAGDTHYYPEVGMATGISYLPPGWGPRRLPEPAALFVTDPTNLRRPQTAGLDDWVVGLEQSGRPHYGRICFDGSESVSPHSLA